MFIISQMVRRVMVQGAESVVWGLSKTWSWQEETGEEMKATGAHVQYLESVSHELPDQSLASCNLDCAVRSSNIHRSITLEDLQ